MKCVICRGQDVQVRKVSEEIKIGSDIVYVPIEVPVCRTCGERYYDRHTMRFLEGIEKQLIEGKVNVEPVGRVLRYA